MDWQRVVIAVVDMLLQAPSAPNGGLSLPNTALNVYCWLPGSLEGGQCLLSHGVLDTRQQGGHVTQVVCKAG